MIRRSYSLSTQDPEAFRRLVDAAAGIGSLQMTVTEIRENPQARPPPNGQAATADAGRVPAHGARVDGP